MTQSIKAYTAAILAVFIIALSFLFSKITLNYASSFTILTHRFLLASLVLLPFFYFKKNELKLSKSEFKLTLKMSILYPILMFSTQILGLNFINSASAGIIQSVQPLMIAFLATIFLKEKTSKIQNIFLLISSFGVIFIFASNFSFESSKEILGNALILLSTFVNSLYVIYSRENKDEIKPFKLSFYCIIFGAIFFVLFYLILGIFHKNGAFFEPFLSLNYNLAILYLALPSSLLTLVFINYSYSKIKAYKLGILNNLIPIIAVIAGVLVLNEKVELLQIFGMILILIGIIGVNFKVIK